VNYGLPSYTQQAAQRLAEQRLAEQRLAEPARDLARIHERSLENKRKLADKIDDNAMLIVAIRFYLARLRASRRTPAAPIRAIEREQSRRFRKHLRAVRRVLGIGYIKATTRPRRKSRFLERDVMAMPGSYRVKLEAIGFDPWSDPDELAAFESLNANLELDEEVAAFARRYPILENVRRFLLGMSPLGGGITPSLLKDKIQLAPQNCAPGSIQNKIYADINNKQARRNFAS
jgi:hypothetical protein